MLKFIGSGSAFNTKLGNNSAFYKHGKEMILIDCGSNIFQRIKESNLLEGIEKIHVLITHTHADHVGSLADLVLYTYYSHGEFAKPKVIVYFVDNTNVDDILSLNGCKKGVHYKSNELRMFSVATNIVEIGDMDAGFYFFKSEHVEEIPSYSIELSINGVGIYYSGDIKNIDEITLKEINKDDEFYNYNVAYIDTCKADYEGNVHLSLRKLSEVIRPEYRHKVWCMHLDEGFSREEAEKLGFNVVKNIFE